MSATAVQESPNIQEMVVIHRIFRRGFPRLADLARRVPAHDTAWSGAVAAHAEFLLNGLHHHHTAEDEHLWPRLRLAGRRRYARYMATVSRTAG